MNERLFHFLNGFAGASPARDALIIFFAEYAGFLLLFAFLGYGGLLHARGGQRASRDMLWSIGAAGAAWLGAHALKWAIAAPRPFVEIPDARVLFEHGRLDSFPSGHTTFFFALGLALFPRRRAVGSALMAGALIIGAARVAAGVHWPRDIVGGVALSFLVCFVAYRLQKRYSPVI